MPVKVTVFFWPGLITEIFFVWTIALPPPSFCIVSVTAMLTSCESPESSTVTANARFGGRGDRVLGVGRTASGRPAAPSCRRCSCRGGRSACRRSTRRAGGSASGHRALGRTGRRFATNVESGGDDAADALVLHHGLRRAPGTGRPRRRRSRADGRPAPASSAASPVVFDGAARCERLREPVDAADPQLQRLDQLLVLRREAGRAGRGSAAASRSGAPGRRSRGAWSTRSTRPSTPGVVSAFATAVPSSCELVRDRPQRRPCSSRTSRASTSTRTTGSASPKKTSSATRIAISASRRRIGRQAARRAATAGASRCRGRRGAAGASARAALATLVVAGSSSKKSNSMSSSRGSIQANLDHPFAGRRRKCPAQHRRNPMRVLGRRSRTSSSSAGTGRSARSAPAGWATSGSPATSRAVSTSR